MEEKMKYRICLTYPQSAYSLWCFLLQLWTGWWVHSHVQRLVPPQLSPSEILLCACECNHSPFSCCWQFWMWWRLTRTLGPSWSPLMNRMLPITTRSLRYGKWPNHLDWCTLLTRMQFFGSVLKLYYSHSWSPWFWQSLLALQVKKIKDGLLPLWRASSAAHALSEL